MILWILLSLAVLYVLLVVIAITAVVLDNHQPAETIAWVVVIASVPVLGLLLYFFFGQDLRRERLFSKKSLDLLTHKMMSRYVSQKGNSDIPKEDIHLIRFMKMHNYAFPFVGNDVHVFTEGEDFIGDMLRHIGRATHHIHMEFYIVEDDPVGRLVHDALMDAAGRGVKVRFIYDDVGCWNVPRSFFREMEKAGIEVVSVLPVRFHRFAHHINYRNHRKLVVIDGKIGYVGGMNLALRYVRPVQGKKWYDTHIRIEGSGVYGLQLLFLSNWFWTSREMVNAPAYYPPCSASSNSGVLLQIVSSVPFSNWPALMMGYCKAIHNARKRVLIQTPYFMPTQSLIESLQTAAMSGVQVQLMVPEKPGGFWMTWCNQSYFGDMLKAGVELYTYLPGMMHAKMIVVDDRFVSIGSANMDFRSMLDTFEACAFIYDEGFCRQMQQRFFEARKDCKRIDLQTWRSRSLRRRLIASFVRIFSPMF